MAVVYHPITTPPISPSHPAHPTLLIPPCPSHPAHPTPPIPPCLSHPSHPIPCHSIPALHPGCLPVFVVPKSVGVTGMLPYASTLDYCDISFLVSEQQAR